MRARDARAGARGRRGRGIVRGGRRRWIRGRAVVRGGGLRVSDAGFGGGFGFAAGGVSSGDDGASARGAAVARRDHRERGAGGAVGRRHG